MFASCYVFLDFSPLLYRFLTLLLFQFVQPEVDMFATYYNRFDFSLILALALLISHTFLLYKSLYKLMVLGKSVGFCKSKNIMDQFYITSPYGEESVKISNQTDSY